MKTFFDGIFISKEHLEEAGIKYPIKLEYYKIARDENVRNTNQINETENTKGKYGIEVVKTEYLEGNVKIETKEVANVTNDLDEADRILTLLRNNEVTPVSVEDVLEDLQKVEKRILKWGRFFFEKGTVPISKSPSPIGNFH